MSVRTFIGQSLLAASSITAGTGVMIGGVEGFDLAIANSQLDALSAAGQNVVDVNQDFNAEGINEVLGLPDYITVAYPLEGERQGYIEQKQRPLFAAISEAIEENRENWSQVRTDQEQAESSARQEIYYSKKGLRYAASFLVASAVLMVPGALLADKRRR